MVKLPLEIHLAGPAEVREEEAASFTLEFLVQNLGAKTIDPRLGTSVLRVNDQPLKDWDITINNGPRWG